MARPRNIDRTEPTKVYLSSQNAARLRLAAYSPLRGKAEHGELSRLVNLALDHYFKETPECIAKTPSPDSTTSGLLPNSGT
jgi:hypothetical protein